MNADVLILLALATASSTALAQYSPYDPRSNVYNNESLRRQDEIRRNEEAARSAQQAEDRYGSKPSSPQTGGQAGAGGGTDMRALGKELLRLPPLPVERNVLLGSWRLEGGGQQSKVLEFGLTGKGATPGMGELMGFMKSIESGQLACDMSFGRGITFTPTTFSSGGAAGIAGGPVAYRSRKRQVIVAIPADSRANPMPFTIAGPNRIVWADTCALVRVGSATPTAQSGPSNRATAPSNAGAPPPEQVATAAPARSTLARPSPEVCRNTLLDKLGVVGTNQVRALSDVRYKEIAIEGKVPRTNNLRIDLRGSACDDPRIKATLYDFDGNEMLQSITYVWDRPPGPAPTPLFTERIAQLSRFHTLPPSQSPSRLQADISLGRLILEDLPERNLLLEAYKARK